MTASIEQALTYLQGNDQLQAFVMKLLCPNPSQTLQTSVATFSKYESLEKWLIDFCVEHNLIDCNHFQQWLNSRLSIFPSHTKLNDVFQFIESHYHQPITLRDVADAVGYSPAYLTDLVRRETGKPVNHWIIERRLKECCRLLQETDQTVNQIAEAMGYQNPGHFFRQFRQRYGTTPQSWRNSHQ